MSKQQGWRWVTSKTAARKGEVFIMYDDIFVLKVYAEGTADNEAFAQWLVGQLRRTTATPENPKAR